MRLVYVPVAHALVFDTGGDVSSALDPAAAFQRTAVSPISASTGAATRSRHATVETGMNQPNAGKGDEVDSVIEAQVVLPYSRKRDLKEISRRGDLHHRIK